MKFLLQLLLAAACLSALPAAAQRLPVPIVNHENVLVQGTGGQPLTAAKVREAIIAAATATGRQWTIAEPSPGRLIATYQVRTHMVMTEIVYNAETFSVKYHNSVNMKYTSAEGGKIHPFYNQWVQEFVAAVRLQLQKA